MKFKRTVVVSMALTLIIMVSFSAVFAATKDVQASSVLSKYQQQRIYEAIQNQLVDTYGDSYIFENFTYDINEEKIVGTDRLIDIDVYVDMMLTRSVSENAFVQGMLDKIDELEGKDKVNRRK